MESVAVHFLEDLTHVLIEYIWLQISKITDPAKDDKNLTVEYIDNRLSEFSDLSQHIRRYRQKI